MWTQHTLAWFFVLVTICSGVVTPNVADKSGGTMITLESVVDKSVITVQCSIGSFKVPAHSFSDTAVICVVPTGLPVGKVTVTFATRNTKDGAFTVQPFQALLDIVETPVLSTVTPFVVGGLELSSSKPPTVTIQGSNFFASEFLSCLVVPVEGVASVIRVTATRPNKNSVECQLPDIPGYIGNKIKIAVSNDAQIGSTTVQVEVVDVRFTEAQCKLSLGTVFVQQQRGSLAQWSGVITHKPTIQQYDGGMQDAMQHVSSPVDEDVSSPPRRHDEEQGSSKESPQQKSPLIIRDGPYQLHIHATTLPENVDSCSQAGPHWTFLGQDPIPVHGNSLQATSEQIDLKQLAPDSYTQVLHLTRASLSMVLHNGTNGNRIDCCNWQQSYTKIPKTVSVEFPDKGAKFLITLTKTFERKLSFNGFFKGATTDVPEVFRLAVLNTCTKQDEYIPNVLNKLGKVIGVNVNSTKIVEKAEASVIIPYLSFGGVYSSLEKNLAVIVGNSTWACAKFVVEEERFEGNTNREIINVKEPDSGASLCVPCWLVLLFIIYPLYY